MNIDMIGLDFETYSDVDLRVHGLYRYTRSENFKVLLAAVAIHRGDTTESIVIDFVADHEKALEELIRVIESGTIIVAHNAMFEFAVLHRLGLHVSPHRFVDSAVCSSVAGLGRSLEAAAPQALNIDKMGSGKEGIQLFSIPGTYQMETDHPGFDPKVVEDNREKWDGFKEYCALDAALSLELATRLIPIMDENELIYSTITMEMNLQGWTVDTDLVAEMDRRYKQNVEDLVAAFREKCDAPELNLSSSQQLIAWCAERGIRTSSLDKENVSSLLTKIRKRLDSMKPEDKGWSGYQEVVHMLETKQEMGGSSLKKLRTILDTVDPESHVLHDQYLHAGADASLRTTGRSVQVQNLKRLGAEPDDVTELFDHRTHWSNEKMARNLRQVLIADDPLGNLIVGDYSAVESRGLAWYSGEDWKLDAYWEGLGVYEMQASKFFNTQYEDVTSDQRTFGKVGELSCGYQAGPVAVQGFAEKLGVALTEGEATKLVADFRATNPKTVQFWHSLQSALDEAYEVGLGMVRIPHGTIEFSTRDAIASLKKQTGRSDLKTLQIKVDVPMANELFRMRRIFHGLYRDGRNFQYWRPSARKTGDLWVPNYTDPKTGERRNYSLYGGKVAGILTQSLCREIFMDGMASMSLWSQPTTNVRLTGQLHDELVVGWKPGSSVIDPGLGDTVQMMRKVMSTTDLPGFPLACQVKYSYGYTK